MTHHERARALRDEFEAVTGIWPTYPRSHAALQNLRSRLNRFTAARDAKREYDAAAQDRRGSKKFKKEFQRLAAIEDDPPPFDLDKVVPPPVKSPPSRIFQLRRDAKDEFLVDGAAHVFSTFY
jgi:hypothetical protein